MRWFACIGWSCMYNVDDSVVQSNSVGRNRLESFDSVAAVGSPSIASFPSPPSRIHLNLRLGSEDSSDDGSLWIKEPEELSYIVHLKEPTSPGQRESLKDSILHVFELILEPQLNSAFKLIHDLPTLQKVARVLLSESFSWRKREAITLEAFSQYLFSACKDREELLFLLDICGRIGFYSNFRADLWQRIILPFMIKHADDKEILELSTNLLQFTSKVSFCSFFQRQLDKHLIVDVLLAKGVSLLIGRFCQDDFEEESCSPISSTRSVYDAGTDSDDESVAFEASIPDTVTL